ncbi:Fc.00g098850.m01.CDS01 [Cosmosporella sp. VM-42]
MAETPNGHEQQGDPMNQGTQMSHGTPISQGTSMSQGPSMNPGPQMNQGPPDMYYSQQHMSASQAHQPQTVTSGAMSHSHQQQPPLALQPSHQYSNSTPYNQYHTYPTGLTSPPTAPPSVSNSVLPPPGVNPQGGMGAQFNSFDTTGQQPPPGMKPRVTATLWEDEGSLCFQVEARGICVARREDNHMINGTKLLNVAGMTRGRRDGILKSEKVRHVVKIGPMHLKGVWIPYDRALDFANKEKITELLYPLFVYNIGALLYHPTNQTRTTQVMQAAERRSRDNPQMRNPAPGLPSIGSHHHHSMNLPGPQPSLPSHNNMGRPLLGDRAHTFPTPPQSASSVIGNIGSSDNFNWQGQGMSGPQGTNPMSIEAGITNARSMPTTPATTPPGNTLQSMQPYANSGSQSYDGPRPMYNGPSSQQSPYQTSAATPQDRMYGQNNSYAKNDMGPPSSRPSQSGPSGEQPDTKPPNGLIHSDQAAQSHNADDEADHEQHDPEYTHDSSSYDNNRSYNYTAPAVGSLTSDSNLSPEMTGLPSHPPASGRATPRSAAPSQPYYSQHAGYSTSPRAQQTTGSLNYVMSNDRAPTNGALGYTPAPDVSGSLTNGYSSQAPTMNGTTGVLKRGRDDEDDLSRPASESMDLKRRKTMLESTVSAPAYDALTQPGQPPRRR